MDTSDEGRMSRLKEFLLTFFMPEKCYDQFFLHFNFMHVPCLKILSSKTMGILILVGIVIAPLPQIWKVLWSGSSNGLCITSIFLELLAISTHAAFCYNQNFPIGAWGESLFALIQIAVLALLVQHYQGKTIKGVCFLALYCGFMFLLGSPLTPVSVVLTLNEWNVLLVIAGRFFQARSNFRSGHTGQLSALSVFLVFLGSLGRIFSSLQAVFTNEDIPKVLEDFARFRSLLGTNLCLVTGLSLSTQLHAVACCCSAVILAQVLMYWSKSMINSKKEREVEKDKAE